MPSKASERAESKWQTYTEVARKRYEPDESDDDGGTRVYRRTVKMLEFTEVYPPFFSVLPATLRVLSLSTNPYKCPTRISPFYANRDSRIYQFICCTWSARRPAECDTKTRLTRAQQSHVYKKIYTHERDTIIGCQMVIYGRLRSWTSKRAIFIVRLYIKCKCACILKRKRHFSLFNWIGTRKFGDEKWSLLYRDPRNTRLNIQLY